MYLSEISFIYLSLAAIYIYVRVEHTAHIASELPFPIILCLPTRMSIIHTVTHTGGENIQLNLSESSSLMAS